MNSIRASLTVLAFLIGFGASAKEVSDTLYSAKNDRIIITYSLTQKDNKVFLEFKNVRKLLGNYHCDKYEKETGRIHTLFFDWIGTRKDMKFTGDTPSAICLPAKASYMKSSDGYFVVEQRPSLSFDLAASETKTITIPIYLAHYEGKQHYKILCSCGNLIIHIPNSTSAPSSTTPSVNKKQTHQSGVEYAEIGEEFDKLNEQALNLIKSINKDLPSQDTLPMDNTLLRKVDNLVDLQSQIQNEDIVKKIDETLEAYNNKKKELEKRIESIKKVQQDDKAFTDCNSKEDYERYVKQHPEGKHVDEAKSKISDFETKAKEEEDHKKKRTIWMIIGGVLLAILLFVGNQVLQSFRNIRTQRSMMQMQQDATKRAQNIARSKARSEIRKQTNKVTGQVRKKSQSAIRGAADKIKNNQGNNRVSI